ncbi:hypothetical protein [uncultured Aquimarina sp.]|uniref:hypothetical protein n=1 Tax=uncultured Aquimarina sp. TaxID=575652 RepID=UPI002624DB75|nr:hypothetical protein [uncultured Aquimarina sp.]
MTILSAIFAILSIITGFWANSIKENLDHKDQMERDNKTDKILESNIKTEFNTSSARFFQENNDFEKYSNFFKYGFVVYHQSLDFDKPFKKAYGSKIHVEYIEYSNSKILKPKNKNKRYKLQTDSKYKKVAGNRNLSNNTFVSYIDVGVEAVGNIQLLNGFGNYGQPDYNFCDYFVLLSPEPPFTFAIGPQDCNILKKIRN